MKPTMICKLVKAGQTARRLVRYIAKKAVGLRADLGFGVMKLRRPMLPWAAEVLCANRDSCPRASEVRHVIFSAQKGMARRAAFAALHAVFADWRATYAPGRPWVAAVQDHNGIYHLHAAVGNVDSSGKPLKILPHQVVAMADMRFTDNAISAKGQGKKGLPVYTKARAKLAVQDLAEQLVDDNGRMRDDEWERLKTEGVISNFRTRQKDAAVTSFEFEGRRIRIKTLRAFISEKQNRTQQTKETIMPIEIIDPTQPLPDSLAAKLTAAGFSQKALDSLNAQLGAAHAAHEPDSQTPTQTLNRDTPKL